MEEGTTTTITFRSSPPLPEDGFGFEFSIILATENGTAIGKLTYIYMYNVAGVCAHCHPVLILDFRAWVFQYT